MASSPTKQGSDGCGPEGHGVKPYRTKGVTYIRSKSLLREGERLWVHGHRHLPVHCILLEGSRAYALLTTCDTSIPVSIGDQCPSLVGQTKLGVTVGERQVYYNGVVGVRPLQALSRR